MCGGDTSAPDAGSWSNPDLDDAAVNGGMGPGGSQATASSDLNPSLTFGGYNTNVVPVAQVNGPVANPLDADGDGTVTTGDDFANYGNTRDPNVITTDNVSNEVIAQIGMINQNNSRPNTGPVVTDFDGDGFEENPAFPGDVPGLPGGPPEDQTPPAAPTPTPAQERQMARRRVVDPKPQFGVASLLGRRRSQLTPGLF